MSRFFRSFATKDSGREYSKQRATSVMTVLPAVDAGKYHLTQRERVVLRLLARGLSNQEISRQLHLSVDDTCHSIRMIYRKLHVRDRVEAAVKAIQEAIA